MIDFNFAPGGDNSEELAVSEPTFFERLNPPQREAAKTTEGPLIVLAGAGSGKTSMLTSRIAHLILSGKAKPSEVLAVTFTNKAAQEMRHRVEKLLNTETPSRNFFSFPEIGTFHSVCVRILRQEMLHLPFEKAFVIYDDSDQLSLIKQTMKKLDIDDKNFSPKAFQAAINRLKCDAVEAKDVEPGPYNYFEKNLKKVFETYQQELFAHQAIDFGEIICLTYRLLRDHPDVRKRYQSRFKYIHVDEYQDTNRSQYLLLSTLSSKEMGGHQNICVVGDEDQSIYKWRGADIRNILDFEKDYPGAKVIKLEQNYRSTQTIIEAASDLIQNNTQRKAKKLWTDNEVGSKIQHIQVFDERAEAEYVTREIKRMASEEGKSLGDFAIFYRTNAQSRQFEDLFNRDRILYQIVGGLRFYERKEIKDILSYFRVLLNPSDTISLKRIINTPARGIGKSTIEKIDEYLISQEAQGLERMMFWEALIKIAKGEIDLLSAATAKKIANFVRLMQKLMEVSQTKKLTETYHLLLDDTAYIRELKLEGTEEALARIDNLEELDTLLSEFEEEVLSVQPEALKQPENKDLVAQFLERTTLSSDIDQLESLQSSVKMMTLHSSKGLEFPVVFLVGMEEGLFPSLRQWEEESDADIEEERRLCYVGMTRAKENLFLLNALSRRTWGNIHYRDPSRFFQEIPGEWVEMKDLTRKRLTQNYGSGGSYSATRSSSGSFLRGSLRSGGADEFSQEYEPASRGAQIPKGKASAGALIGRKMTHPEYGPGTIISEEGSGEQKKVLVEFLDRDRRKFLVRYVQSFLDSQGSFD